MSVAFRRDSDEEHLEPKFELPIPSGPNLVTARGLALIGARPVWDAASHRVVGIGAVPKEILKTDGTKVKLNEDTIVIDESDLEERFVRSSGPGGQNVNKASDGRPDFSDNSPYVAMVNRDDRLRFCPRAALAPLTADKDELQRVIGRFRAEGQHIGVSEVGLTGAGRGGGLQKGPGVPWREAAATAGLAGPLPPDPGGVHRLVQPRAGVDQIDQQPVLDQVLEQLARGRVDVEGDAVNGRLAAAALRKGDGKIAHGEKRRCAHRNDECEHHFAHRRSRGPVFCLTQRLA